VIVVINTKENARGKTQAGLSPWGKCVALAIAITLVVAYQLFQTARLTGNYEGMWFSLAHTVIVAVGVVWALRT
jgi:hypothetical protein